MKTNEQTAILAAGDFPRKMSPAWEILANAKRVVCCDGAADLFRRRFHREPDVVIGDGDSVRGSFANFVRVAEQETNDLAKAIRWCREKKWKNLAILGATGKRDDHTLGNIFCAMEMGVEVVTDYGRFIPFDHRENLRVAKGTAISIFATNPATRMTSVGLQWKLNDVRFENLFCATLNRASATRVTVTTTHRAFLFVAT